MVYPVTKGTVSFQLVSYGRATRSELQKSGAPIKGRIKLGFTESL